MPDHAAHPTADNGFELILQRQGLHLRVQANERITDVLQLAGIAIETLCEQGVCGTCVTPWLQGEIEHNDSCLSHEERRTAVALCCARSLGSQLTLDL